ncbi:MAG: FAD-binding oxidoreductase [bacterium]
MRELLAGIVGKNNVSVDGYELLCYSRDCGSMYPVRPQYVVIPKCRQHVEQIMRLAYRRKNPVVARGAGTSMCGAPIPVENTSILLDLTSLRQLEINEDARIVIADAGVTWTELMLFLERKGWEIAHEGPWSAPSATLGGSLAVGAISMGFARYGGLGTQITGLEVVLPNGQRVVTGSGANPGSTMVMRECNGTDLTGLFIGSHGVLGIVTRVALKIYPLSREQAFSSFGFPSLAALIAAIKKITLTEAIYDCRLFISPVPEQIPGKYGFAYMIKARNGDIKTMAERARNAALSAGGTENVAFGKEFYLGRHTARVKAFGKAGPGWLEVAGFVPFDLYEPIANKVLVYFAQRQAEMDRLGVRWSLGGLLESRSLNIPMALFCNELKTDARGKMLVYLEELGEIMFGMGVSPYWIGKQNREAMWRLGPTYELHRTIKKALDPDNILNPGIL